MRNPDYFIHTLCFVNRNEYSTNNYLQHYLDYSVSGLHFEYLVIDIILNDELVLFYVFDVSWDGMSEFVIIVAGCSVSEVMW